MKLCKGISLIVALLLALMGCSKVQPLNELVNNNPIIKMEIHRQGPYPVKLLRNQKDINKLLTIFKKVQYKKASNQEDVNGWSFFIVFYYKDGSKSTVTFIGNRLEYSNNHLYYDIDKNIRSQLSELYHSLP